jgi:hypothetical protein
LKQRRGIATALLIFIIALIVGGFVMIIFDQVFQSTTSWQVQNYPSGVYDPNVLLFFQDGWTYMAIIVVVIMSVWLYLRSEESSVGQD